MAGHKFDILQPTTVGLQLRAYYNIGRIWDIYNIGIHTYIYIYNYYYHYYHYY